MRALLALLLLSSPLLAETPPGPGDTRPVEKAVDEIGDILRTRPEKTLAIAWVMDASGSMDDDRKLVLAKLDELLAAIGGKEVRMTVLAFDKKPRVVCPLTMKMEQVKAAIAEVGGGRGDEHCMLAVREAAKLVPVPGSYRAVILMTDERGDDDDELEETIKAARKARVHVFLLGRETPFGWPIGYERDAKLGFNVTVDAGPESAAIETLQKDPICCQQEAYAWCRKMLVDRARREFESGYQRGDPFGCDLGCDEEVLSGFAPWAQARLVRETEGQVWLIRGKGDYDAKAMRGYEPDLCSLAEYDKRNAADPVRKAVVEILAEVEKGKDWKLHDVDLSRGQADNLGKRAQELAAQLLCLIHFLEQRSGHSVCEGNSNSIAFSWCAWRSGSASVEIKWWSPSRLIVRCGLWQRPPAGPSGPFEAPLRAE